MRWIKENGLRGGILLPAVPPDVKWVKPLYDPEYDRLWKNHVLPAFGARQISSVSQQDIRSLHKSLVETPYSANRASKATHRDLCRAHRPVHWSVPTDGRSNARGAS